MNILKVAWNDELVVCVYVYDNMIIIYIIYDTNSTSTQYEVQKKEKKKMEIQGNCKFCPLASSLVWLM